MNAVGDLDLFCKEWSFGPHKEKSNHYGTGMLELSIIGSQSQVKYKISTEQSHNNEPHSGLMSLAFIPRNFS